MEIDIQEQKIYETDPRILDKLLYDHTTNKNIVWATDNYISYGQKFSEPCEIKPELITGKYKKIIQPRVAKSTEEQEHRTKDKAEVFTPTWVCKKQNDLIDENWFKDLNTLQLKDNKNWTDYIALNRLEICCGEGPYIANRYDAVTGEEINFNKRNGFLDRKLRLVNKFSNEKDEWFKYTFISLKATFGYEYQGDNLLIARENILYSVSDAFFQKFHEDMPIKKMLEISDIISWNVWQMDGLNNTTPFSKGLKPDTQLSLFDLDGESNDDDYSELKSKIYDWNENLEIEFESLI